MAKEKMLWNSDKTLSVRASMIREIGIHAWYGNAGKSYLVDGWFNSRDNFPFGEFETEDEARQFVEELHRQIES